MQTVFKFLLGPRRTHLGYEAFCSEPRSHFTAPLIGNSWPRPFARKYYDRLIVCITDNTLFNCYPRMTVSPVKTCDYSAVIFKQRVFYFA